VAVGRGQALLLALLLVLPAEPVCAVQQHGGIEGMVAHELGHLLFLFGMGFLLYRMRQPATRPLTHGRGWVAFRSFIWLIILWNVMTFYGHWHEEVISPDKFVLLNGERTAFRIASPLDLLFYLSRLDHLVLLPAFLCLLQALRQWRTQE
jgi:hypothetical protein